MGQKKAEKLIKSGIFSAYLDLIDLLLAVLFDYLFN